MVIGVDSVHGQVGCELLLKGLGVAEECVEYVLEDREGFHCIGAVVNFFNQENQEVPHLHEGVVGDQIPVLLKLNNTSQWSSGSTWCGRTSW